VVVCGYVACFNPNLIRSRLARPARHLNQPVHRGMKYASVGRQSVVRHEIRLRVSRMICGGWARRQEFAKAQKSRPEPAVEVVWRGATHQNREATCSGYAVHATRRCAKPCRRARRLFCGRRVFTGGIYVPGGSGVIEKANR